MKIRTGFVSNSSSSSFIVISKTKPTKKMFMDAFNVPETSPLFGFTKDIAKLMCADLTKLSLEDIEDYSYNGKFDKYLEKGLSLYRGYASNESGDVEEALCYMDINHTSDDFIIIKEGGY